MVRCKLRCHAKKQYIQHNIPRYRTANTAKGSQALAPHPAAEGREGHKNPCIGEPNIGI